MDTALVQDVVAEVMKRLGQRHSGNGHGITVKSGVRAGEDAPANEQIRRKRGHVEVPLGEYGIFGTVEECVAAAGESQKKLMRLSLEDRESIVKNNAEAWGKMELDETRIGRLDHKIEKLQILELVPGVESLKTLADSGCNGLCLEEFAPFGIIGI